MGFLIEDGKGSGILAAVGAGNRLKTQAVMISSEHYANHNDGQAFNLIFSQTPTGANDCFVFIRNTSENDIVIEGVSIKSAGAEQINFYFNNDGSAGDVTIATPSNCNAGSGRAADGFFATGNDISGLTQGTLVTSLFVPSGTETKHYNFPQDLIIPKNRNIVQKRNKF